MSIYLVGLELHHLQHQLLGPLLYAEGRRWRVWESQLEFPPFSFSFFSFFSFFLFFIWGRGEGKRKKEMSSWKKGRAKERGDEEGETG